MVKDVYTNIQFKIYGLLSDPLTLKQEVCHGCLFSMLLYIIATEVPASFINANEDASRSKIKFSKSQASAQFPLKYLALILETLFLITPNGTK